MLEPTYDKKQETTFCLKVLKAEDLDLRDYREKRHDLVFILLGVILGFIRY